MGESIEHVATWNPSVPSSTVTAAELVPHVYRSTATTVCWRLNLREEPMEWVGDLHVARTLPVAEAVHRALVALAGKGLVVDCPELIGQDGIGQPLSGRHEHAKILPLDLDGDHVLDHVLLHAPMGLGEVARQAVHELRVLRVSALASVRLRILGSDHCDASEQRLVHRFLPPMQGAEVWTSVTPYVPPRFLKKSGKNSLVGQVQAELATRGFPTALVCEAVSEVSAAMKRFIRTRREGKLPPPQNVGFGLRLQFAEPVRGPLALGYASHFGLGWLAAE